MSRLGPVRRDGRRQALIMLQEALVLRGWKPSYLSVDRCTARIDRRDRETGYVPFNRFIRWTHPSAWLPVREVIAPKQKISFAPSLGRHRFFGGFIRNTTPLLALAGRHYLGNDPLIFGEKLSIESLHEFDLSVFHVNTRRFWMVSYIALTFVCEISVENPN